MIKNLAFKGGGVKGIAYVGALQELEAAQMLQGVERIAGTSAGALMGGLICAGYSTSEIKNIMLDIKFKQFESGFNFFRIFSKYGIFSGDYILNFIHDFMNHSPKKLGSNPTFRDMENAGCKKLYVFACNVSKHTIDEFSFDKTPDVIVAEAIRASMSIPFFFKAWKFPNTNSDDNIYVDGGVVFNYPLSFFDSRRFNSSGEINFESLGLYLHAKQKHPKAPLTFSTPLHFTKRLFESLMETQDFEMHEDVDVMQRTIIIDDLNIPATDFHLSKDKMMQLLESGAACTKAYINSIQELQK